MKLLSKIFDRVMDAFVFFACLILLFIALSIATEVASRYFLNRPLGWVIEITEYSMLYIAFLGAAWLLKEEGHVTMDFLTGRLSPRHEAILQLVTSILAAIVCFVLVWWGVKVTYYNFQAGLYIPSPLQPPKFAVLMIIPLGSFLLAVQFLRRAESFRRQAKRDHLESSVSGEKPQISALG